jgi:excisionase family DNA binding protein
MQTDFLMTHHTQLLTIRDAANALRVSYAQTRLWVLEGRLPSIALGQRTRRIPAQQLAKFIANNTTGGN